MDELIEELLDLHCHDCNGQRYGCRGCTKMNDIEKILKKYTNDTTEFES